MKKIKCEICNKECSPTFGNTCCSIGCGTVKQKREEFRRRMLEFIGSGKSEGEMKAHLIKEGPAYKRQGEYAINELLNDGKIALKNNIFLIVEAAPALEEESQKPSKPQQQASGLEFMHFGSRWCSNCSGVENGHVRGYKRCVCKTPSWITEEEVKPEKPEGVMATEGVKAVEGEIVMTVKDAVEIRKEAVAMSFSSVPEIASPLPQMPNPSTFIKSPQPVTNAVNLTSGERNMNNGSSKEANLSQVVELVESIGGDKLLEFAAAHKEISKVRKDLEDIEIMKREKQAELDGLSERYLLLKADLMSSMK